MTDTYWVCDICAHTVSADLPDCCELCHSEDLSNFGDLYGAEDYSERILAVRAEERRKHLGLKAAK